MTFGAVLHKQLLWDFSFSVLGHGIITLKVAHDLQSCAKEKSSGVEIEKFSIFRACEMKSVSLVPRGRNFNTKTRLGHVTSLLLGSMQRF